MSVRAFEGVLRLGADLGQGEEVGGADEEVAVEGADAQALAAADAHDRLPGCRSRQVMPHVVPQLHLPPHMSD